MKRLFLNTISIWLFFSSLSFELKAQEDNVTDSLAVLPIDTVVYDEEEFEEDEYSQPVPGFTADTPALRSVPDSVVARLRDDKDFEYANNPEYWKQKPPSSPGFWDGFERLISSPFTKALFYIALGALAIFVIYRIIVMNNLFLFSSYRKDQEEQVTIDESSLSREVLEQKWKVAKANGDFRSAVRYLFLITLQALREKEYIRYHPEATNQEYINQLSSTTFGRDFKGLSRAYEYAWYGEVEIHLQQFEIAEKYFLHFIKRVG